MAGNTSGERYIGKLKLDITDIRNKADQVDKILKGLASKKEPIDLSKRFVLDTKEIDQKVEAINNALAKIGSNAGVKIQIADEVKKQIDKIYKELQDSVKKIDDATQKAVASINKIGESKIDNAQKNRELRETINNLREYYTLLKQAEQAKAQGNFDNYLLYTNAANEALANVNASLREQAEEYKTVAKAKREYEASQNKSAAKSLNEENQEIEKATQAYIRYLEAKQKVADLETIGEKDTENYINAEHAMQKAEAAFNKYSDAARAAAIESKEVAAAMEEMQKRGQIVSDSVTAPKYLDEAKQKYKELTDAIQKYKDAIRSGNKDEAAIQQSNIDSIMREVGLIRQKVEQSNIEAGVKQQILNYINQCTIAQDQLTRETQMTASATGEIESQMTGLLTRMFSLLAVIRSIRSLIQNTVEYVSEYSDKMSEIQMITLKTDEEVARLADTYRDLAAMMNVSSLDMADAAIYFTRQGLGAAEIENRLKNVTMYAKAANVEFKDASEIITAVVNSMGLVNEEMTDGRSAAQRVADVFLKVGDSAATSGQEIGEAMQKAAASAGAFGMSFEWLASYIATVSETTRQEARTIGTALNTIIARLHQIKQNGYNSEDETKINDVQKALAKINVALMDENNEWRDMDMIFQEIGAQWDKLDGKTKSYIATTMAGVKQQNVFLALMNDLGKGVEGNSRAWELYDKAINSAGTAADKYAVYLDSVTASQERLNIAQEKFYSLMDSGVIKGWNDMWAGFINNITKGAELTKGLNIILPVAIGLFTAFSIAVQRAGTASAFFASIWEKHPILVAIGAAAAVMTTLISTISSFASAVETAEERVNNANQAISESQSRIADYRKIQGQLGDVFDAIGRSGGKTDEVLTEYKDILDKIANVSPTAKQAVEDMTAGLKDQTTTAEILNQELEKQIEIEKQLAALALVQKYNNITPENISSAAQNTDWARHYFDSASGVDYTDWSFEEILQRKYLAKQVGSITDLPQEVYDYIQEQIDQYNLEDAEASWGFIGRLVWQEFGLGDLDHTKDQMKNAVKSAIDDVISSMSAYMNIGDLGILRKRLVDAIFGDDGDLDETEYQNYAKNIGLVLSDIIANGFQYSEEEIEERREELLQHIADISGEHLNDNGDMMLWEDLDLDTVQLVSDLVDAGTALSKIKAIMKDSSSVDEFTEKLNNLGKELGSDLPDDGQETIKTFSDLIKEIKSYTKEVDKVDEVITALKNGDAVKSDDLLDLASAHPEIMGFMHDTEELIRQLEKIKKAEKDAILEDTRNMLLDNSEFMKNSSFSDFVTDDIQTLRQYMDSLDEADGELFELSNYVELATAQFLAASGNLDKVDIDKIKEIQNALFFNSNVNLNGRPTIDASKLTEAGWENAGEGIATVFTNSYTAGKEGLKWNENVIVSLTPILDNGDVMSPDALNKYMEELLAKSGSAEELFVNDAKINGGKGLLIDVTAVADDESFEEAETRVESLMILLHKLQEVLYGKPEGEKSWLEEQVEAAAKTAELEWAKSNAYTEQMGELAYTVQNEGVREAIEVWDVYDEKLQKAIAETYPDLAKSILEAKQAIDEETGSEEKQAKATDSMTKAISKYQKYATAQNFTKTYAAIQKLEKGTISAAEAFDTFYSETDKITKAQEEINTATDKLADGVELAVSDVNDLAGVLGISADQILQDFPGAVDMFNQLISETGDLQAAFDALNEAAFIRITGVSEADFSAIMNGLDVVVDKASETVKMLEATGQWKVETIKLEGMQNVLENGKLVQKVVHGFQDVLRPTGNNPYKGTNKSNYSGSNNKKSGGGGGENSDSNQMTEVELMLNRMEQMQAIIESQQGFYSAQSNYYKQTGHLQGVIGYSQKEIQVLEAQNDVLKQNIEQIDKYRQQKEAELEALDVSDEKYEEVRDDLDKLQKAHQQYTKQVIENETAIDQLNETIKETQKQIRDMQIKIREQIYKAIEDREKKAKNMLQNEITMENTILDIIKRKYEIERDKIIENTDARITALQEEKDLLSEQLRIRKEMAEEEDKAAKLAQLEANYNRIVADPTRAKEAKKIQDEINALRKEMAWDAAEKEVQAQQDSIDQQITSLEDYKQYIEEYYEDLFEHPAKLIEEMRNIITRTDDEILDWLKQNSEEYAASSENTQHQMVNTWSDTLDEMRGRIKTYWDEVEEIIAGGDDKIIQFLIDNSEDYARAGKLQAEKYVDEWREELEDLHKALEAAFTIDAPNYVVMDPGTGGSSGGGSGSGGGGGGNGTNTETKYQARINYQTGSGSWAQAQGEGVGKTAEEAKNNAKAEASRKIPKSAKAIDSPNYYKIYAAGGIADFTGPAWLDGTKQNPERILSPYQTKLFETMVQALEKMSTISIPSMPNFGNLELTGSGGVNVGDIIVNVDNLDTDDDYEELAEKVSEVLMERIGRTTVVGGLRINS